MRLIDADELYDEIEYDALFNVQTAKDIVELIFSAPTIEAVPVRHGKWITQDSSRTKFMCSECKFKNYGGHEKYCPNCGASMT